MVSSLAYDTFGKTTFRLMLTSLCLLLVLLVISPRPLINPVANVVYAVFVALRLCPKQSKIVDIDAFNSTNVHMLSADAQRQR